MYSCFYICRSASHLVDKWINMQREKWSVLMEHMLFWNVFFKTQIESSSQKSLYATLFSLIFIYFLLQDITCLCVNVGLGAVKFGARNLNQLAAQHSCQNAPQCRLALINCLCLYCKTCSILMQRCNVVEQTNRICHRLFLWLYWWQCMSGVWVKWFSGCEWWGGQRVLLTTFQECRGVNSCFALCLRPISININSEETSL